MMNVCRRRATVVGLASLGVVGAGLGRRQAFAAPPAVQPPTMATPSRTEEITMGEAFNVTGNLDPAMEAFLTAPPQPDVREASNMWFWDDEGRIGGPRIAVEAWGRNWDNRMVRLNLAFPDGRVLDATMLAPGHPDRADRFGAGPLVFECLEPFRRWKMTYDGPGRWATVKSQLAGEPSAGPDTHVVLNLEAEMAAAPYLRGAMNPQAADIIKNHPDGLMVGRGYNIKHLFRCTGRFQAGDERIEIRGGGLRVRRRGVRDASQLRGHCWQSALFPSGRAFGMTCFPPRPDGGPSYNEAFVHLNGRVIPARVVEAPWMTTFESPKNLSFVLETAKGPISIDGRDCASTFTRHLDDLSSLLGARMRGGAEGLPFHQGIARYRWDGEEAIGMVERSYPSDATRSDGA